MSDRLPLTVGWIGNFTKPWCSEVHFTASMEALGHRVVRLQENETDWKALPALCARQGVQRLFWTRTWPAEMTVVLPALAELREQGVRSCSYHLDRWWGLNREHQVHDQPFFHTDLVVSPDDAPGWAAAGINHLWMPPGVYEPECRIGKANKRRFPHRVVFVGSHPYPHPEWRPYRDELINTLQAHLGRDFGVYPKVRNQPVRGQNLADLYATAEVVIGDSCLSGGATSYWSDRCPESLGRGAFLIHPHVAGMEDWYTDGEHLRTYPLGDFDALLATVDKYLDNPDERQAIAAAGQALVLSRDTYRHRMAAVLDALDDQFGIPEPRPQPATVAATRDRPLPRAGAARTRPTGMLLANRADRSPGPPLVRARHRGRGQPASFEVTGGPTAELALREVFEDDSYGMEAAHVTGKVVVDVGGNCGAFAVLAARMGAAAVHTYEPHPDSFAVLLRNLERNGVSAKVTAHQQAVLGHGASSILVGEGGGAHIGGAGEGVRVPAIGIREAVEAAAGAGGTVGLIKIDVEGGEFDIFSALDAHFLHERVERIVLENHGPGMPHLAHLDADGKHMERWCSMVAMLADCGRLEIMGHPAVGGIIRWTRY